MNRFTYIAVGCLLGGQLLTVPAFAQFDTMQDKQERREENQERILQQSKDIEAMRETQQQMSVLLKGLIVECRKQTVLLNSQNTEQANLVAELQKQTKLLEKLVDETKKMRRQTTTVHEKKED